MSKETALIERYFDAFNRHDLDAVVACFTADAVIAGSDGRRVEGNGGNPRLLCFGIFCLPRC